MNKELRLEQTPLEKILGFEAAEETYDMLPLLAQIILDLRIEGYTEKDIANVLGVAQSTVSLTIKRSRVALLQSKLYLVLELRAHYKETHVLVSESTE
jgi:predicted transcriptional regulator